MKSILESLKRTEEDVDKQLKDAQAQAATLIAQEEKKSDNAIAKLTEKLTKTHEKDLADLQKELQTKVAAIHKESKRDIIHLNEAAIAKHTTLVKTVYGVLLK